MSTLTDPKQFTLGEIIARLKQEDPNQRMALGFTNPHSYRGCYHEVAFKPRRNTTVGECLAAAEAALGATFEGWKGGEYVMTEDTDAWLVAFEGNGYGETIGAVFLELMLAADSAGGSR